MIGRAAQLSFMADSLPQGAAPKPNLRAVCSLLADVHNTRGRKDSRSSTMRHDATKANPGAGE
jgi:hypothetical protein